MRAEELYQVIKREVKLYRIEKTNYTDAVYVTEPVKISDNIFST